MKPDLSCRTVLYVCAALAVGVLVSACGAAAPAASPSTTAVQKPGSPGASTSAAASVPASTASGPALKLLHLGATGSLAADAGVFIASDVGYFAEQGIKVDFAPFSTAVDMIPPLSTGQLDAMGGIASAALWNAVGRGAALKVVAGAAEGDAGPPSAPVTTFVVRKALVDSGRVKTMADMKGLNVVAPPPGNAVELLWALIFKSAGLTRADVNSIQLPITEVASALINGKLDVAAVNEPSTTIVINQGAAVPLLHDYNVYPHAQGGVLFYGPEFAKSDLAQPFMAAYIKAVRLYNDAFVKKMPEARAKVIPALVAHTTLKDPNLYDKLVPPRVDPNGLPNVKSLQDQQDFFVSSGEEPKSVDVNSVVDLQFAKAAVAKLGPYS